MWISTTPEFTSSVGHLLGEAEGDARLWRYVLYQALYDLCFGEPVDRSKAVLWVGSEDMRMCCDYAGLDVGKFMDMMRCLRRLSKTDQRTFLHQLKRYLDNLD